VTDATAPKPKPTASGSFDKTPLANVLVYMHDRKLSGTVEVESEGRTDQIYFQQGFPARVRVDEPTEPLGRVLLEMNLITDEAFTKSLMALGGGKGLQGRILIEQGALDLPGLVKGLREQLRRKLVKVFAIKDARYAYYDELNLLQAYGGGESIRVDPYPILLSGVRYAYQEDRLAPVLARIEGQALRVPEAAKVEERFDLREEDRTIVACLRAQPLTLDAIVAAKIASDRDVRTLAYCLVLTRLAELSRATQAAVALPAAPPAGPDAAPVPPPAAPSARGSVLPPPPPPPKAKPPRIPSAARLPAQGKRASRPDVPAAPPGTSPEQIATREEIVKRAEEIDSEDYFIMLGATREDSEDDLRARYFALAKKWHPDRLHAGLEELRPTFEYIFANLTEAYGTLTDLQKRQRYLEMVREGTGTPADQRKIQTILDAAMNAQKAEVCLRRKNYEEAEQYCRLAIEGNPDDGEAQGLLGWILLTRRETDLPVQDILAILKKAVELSPQSERINFYIGMTLKRTGESAAVTYFRRAAEINPRNFDALREVRLFEMRRDQKAGAPGKRSTIPPGGAARAAKGDDQEKKGLFGKLFGKK